MVAFATEYAQHCCVIDNDAQVAYETNEPRKVRDYLALKYYTNVDVDMQDDPMSYAVDLMELITHKGNPFYSRTNLGLAEGLAERFKKNTIDIYNRYHSLSAKIIKAFGGILNGGDLMKQLAESRDVSEKVLDLLGNASTDESNVMLFKQFGKKGE